MRSFGGWRVKVIPCIIWLSVFFSFVPYKIKLYCTIPTKCSADVTRDTAEHLRQVFEINKGV